MTTQDTGTTRAALAAALDEWRKAGGDEDDPESVARLMGSIFGDEPVHQPTAHYFDDVLLVRSKWRVSRDRGWSGPWEVWVAGRMGFLDTCPSRPVPDLLSALAALAAAGVPLRETVSTPWASAPAPGEGEGTDEPCDIIPWLRQQSKGGCHDAADEIAALRARAETAEAKERVALILSPSRICEEYHYQACHVCERVGCGDNTSPAVVELRALRARVAELEGERHRWRAEAERLRDRACWTPVLREQTKAAADTLIIEAGEAARAGRGEMATSIREARDVLVHGLGRLETERDELSARCARLAAVARAEATLEQVVARSEPPEWHPLRSFDDGPIEGWICSGCGAERDYDDETGDPPDPCPCGIAAERALAVAVVARAALQPGDVEPAPAGGDGGEG
jgi:hypothetical protein